MPLAIQFPSWLKPEIIPGLPIRWYGLMYIVAFGIAFLLYRRQVRERNFPITEDQLSGLFFWGILGLILGARIFSSLVYESGEISSPLLIFWPFRNGRFTGFQGMSYHGGVIGAAAAVVIYSWKKKLNFREIGDMFAASIPLGYTFGRIGNFINGELFGRVTASPLGMIFPHGGIHPSSDSFDLVRDEAAKMGIAAVSGAGGILNFPRHPSQLYEALFEGVVLWAIIWFFRNRKPFKGFLIFLYLSGYGLIRFIIEYFREPDAGLGYRIEFIKNDLPPVLSHPIFSFSTGQILCFVMILAGIIWAVVVSRMPDKSPVRVYASGGEKRKGPGSAEREAEKAARRKERRKLRGKLR